MGIPAKEAGEVAQKSGARRLLLTRVSPDMNTGQSLEDAKASVGNEVFLAQEAQTHEMSPRIS